MTQLIASGLSGKLKIWTLVLGIVVIVLASRSAYYNTVREHEAMYASAIVCFIISMLVLVGSLVGIVDGHHIFRRFDVGFHFSAAILLIATSIVFILNVVHNTPRAGGITTNDHVFGEQISAGAITLLNGVTYAYIAGLLNGNLKG